MRRSVPGQPLKKEGTSKRRSVPGGNLENKKSKRVEIRQITTCKPRHFSDYPMRYGRSPISGQYSGGFYWNPPADCDKRIFHNPENGERWIDVNICRTCPRHKKNVCEAYNVECSYAIMQEI